MIRSVLAACLLLGAASLAEEADPLLRLEHGLWLQEVQRDVTSAMQEYQAVMEMPDAPGRVLAEARFCMAGCYLEKDSPSAALALYQTIVRVHPDVTPFGRLASERITETTALIERLPVLPSRHVTSRLADRLVLLRAALQNAELPLASTLLDGMNADLAAQAEELELVPTNEQQLRAALRVQAVTLRNAQAQAVRELAAYVTTGDVNRALKMAESSEPLTRWLDFSTLWQADGDWGALVAVQRGRWIAAVSAGDVSNAQTTRATMLELLQPVTTGPRGNPEVQTALRTLEMLQNLEPLVRTASWPAARQQLATELGILYGRYNPAATVRPPNAAAMNAGMLTEFVTMLTHVVEAVTLIDQTSRLERVTAAIDLALQTAGKLAAPWQSQPAAARRLQDTISQLTRAKSEAAIDLQRARRLLRAEIYD